MALHTYLMIVDGLKLRSVDFQLHFGLRPHLLCILLRT